MEKNDICIVTGAAGFIGSHLSERLLEMGCTVIGVDCFTDYYPRALKIKNIEKILHSNKFTLIDGDIMEIDLKKLLSTADYVFHEAAQPGVRKSWGESFKTYSRNNIEATQKLLEGCKHADNIKKFVFASSSSIYGNALEFPIKEDTFPKPVSPYGVSKLAAEHLCYLYWKNYGVPVVSLRYFTVYGPRQRPDMAFSKFISSILAGREIRVFGDGSQTRDFTYISDAINANTQAMEFTSNGEVFNIGGGSRVSVNEVIRILEKISGRKANVNHIEEQKGDVIHTYADITKASRYLNYSPHIEISEGLKHQYDWMVNLVGSDSNLWTI